MPAEPQLALYRRLLLTWNKKVNLIGPEAESNLDAHIDEALAAAARPGDTARFRAAPVHTPRRRLDETTAARKPVLRWRPEPMQHQAAE